MLKKITLVVVAAFALSSTAFGQYFSDFEADNGGWAATGDWEWGSPTGFAGAPFGGAEPVGGFSGDNAWGTIIGGAHNPSTTSNLTQSFTLPAPGTLTFWEYSESGGNTFDMASVLVNGTEEYLSDGNSGLAWRQVSIDVPAGSVDVDFQFVATGVVERVGWYIDDVSITAVPEPNALSLIGLAGLSLLGLRRRF